MSDIKFRSFNANDSDRILKWYKDDKDGFESIMGQAIPDSLACTMLVSGLLHATSQGMALFSLIDHGEKTIGFAGVTNITPSKDFGQPHIYIEPPSRRYSVMAAKSAEKYAKSLGIKNFFASVEKSNKRGLSLIKLLGYSESPRKLFLRELQE
tara:strand:- start:67 stop:525 length:459 start_codon:yes stop_codon:yes gene_type:complete